MNVTVPFSVDCYKVNHYEQYPEGTQLIFSNFTPRRSKIEGINHSIFFGLKYYIDRFLNKYDTELISEMLLRQSMFDKYYSVMNTVLNQDKKYYHIESLMKLGYAPIAIYALPEGAVVPCGVPALVMYNTKPEYFWLPGMLETLMSATLWPMCSVATIAHKFRRTLDTYANMTSDQPEDVNYQLHDFSMRGMFGLEAANMAGMAHLLYFKGTDNVPALMANLRIYNKQYGNNSVPATEHSVMSAGGKENEFETFHRIITDIYPSGIVSIVSDTWDLWNVVGTYLPQLRDIILARDGKVVIRPDSGIPADIICGIDNDDDIHCRESEKKGLIECLWDIFGGTVNSKGFKQLDPHIGAIYGDGITLDVCKDICERLAAKGFASTNVVFGVGSYSYQYLTRDSFGWAMKSTYAEINGEGRAITKDPITDDGTKKSHSGLLKVIKVDGQYQVLQNQTWHEFNMPDNELKLVYKDGETYE